MTQNATVKKDRTKDKTARSGLQNLTLAALFLALALVLPLLTGQIKQLGNMMLPMHIPVMFCGLICGGPYGLAVGFIAPLLRSALFGMPVFFPTALAMAFELATYGFVIGFIYSHVPVQGVVPVYFSLITAMVLGRLVWGLADMILLGITGSRLTAAVFLSSAVLTAIPGIIIQLVLIPLVMAALDRAGLVRFRRLSEETGKADKS